MVNVMKFLNPIINALGYILIPLCIYLGISLHNYKTINKELTSKVSDLTMELGIERTNVVILKDSIKRQNESILALNNLYNTKNTFYNEWLSKDGTSKYGVKACDIFMTKDLDKKLELIKGFDVKK